MKWTIFIIVLLSLFGVTVMAINTFPQKTHHQLSDNPKTFSNHYETIILVDVRVSNTGKAIETKLSQPERYTSFNQFALLDAKKRQYPKKEVDGEFVEYWLKDVEIKNVVSPMGTKIKPLTITPPLK